MIPSNILEQIIQWVICEHLEVMVGRGTDHQNKSHQPVSLISVGFNCQSPPSGDTYKSGATESFH